MRTKQHIFLILFFMTFLFFLFFRKGTYKKVEGFTQGTMYHVSYESRAWQDYDQDIEDLLGELDQSLSTYIDSSLISKINQNKTTKLDAYLRAVLVKALEISKKTKGYFDITVGPVVNLYGFGPDSAVLSINETLIDSVMTYVGYEKITLQDDQVFKEYPEMYIDINAIAQGYTVDVVAQFLDDEGIDNYLVEIGGEVRTRGQNPRGKAWRIGIDKPEENNIIAGQNLQAIVSISGQSLGTSGNYRKSVMIDSIRYTHSIDPRTGKPAVHHLLSATILADECMTADAYATACMVAGLEKSKRFLQQNNQIEGYLIFSNDSGDIKTFTTPDFKEKMSQP